MCVLCSGLPCAPSVAFLECNIRDTQNKSDHSTTKWFVQIRYVLKKGVVCSFFCVCNDPSAGSPTETLLRLLLPLNDKV